MLFKVHGPLMFSKVFRGAEIAVCIYSLLSRCRVIADRPFFNPAVAN